MARGESKEPRQAEKLLMVMLDGREVTMPEIQEVLGSHIKVYRLSTYLWNLKKRGALIKKNKVGRKVVSFQLTNVDVMKEYALKRGLFTPAEEGLKPEDLMVASV